MATCAPPSFFDQFAADALITDAAECAFYAQDVFTKGPAPLAVFRPRNIDELAAGISAAAAEGLAIIPRGGGMSYTSGYVAPEAGALIVDMGRMARILEIDETDMTVTVEAGCAWGALYEALKPKGLRTPLWGTLSGIKASVGGGASQNGLFWGARDGSLVDGALSFDVVLADGSLLTTGKPFFRPYGPDLTGLFAADCGALGIKARATLRLVHDGPAFGYSSFAFDHANDFFAAMSAIAREGLAAESFGFDPFLQSQRMKRESLASDARSLVKLMKAQRTIGSALIEGAKLVAAGRSFLNDAAYSLHCIAEGRNQPGVDADVERISRIARDAGGRPVENSIPKVLRANPFPPPNSMVGPDGERWVPVHGFVPHSALADCWTAIHDLYRKYEADMLSRKVEAGAMFAAVSASAALVEPVFFWPGALNPLHETAVEPQHLARLPRHLEDAEATALVTTLRAEIIALFERFGAAHLQIGRTYPLKSAHDPAGWALLQSVKRQLDPQGLMNPGSLGL